MFMEENIHSQFIQGNLRDLTTRLMRAGKLHLLTPQLYDSLRVMNSYHCMAPNKEEIIQCHRMTARMVRGYFRDLEDQAQRAAQSSAC